MSYSKDQLKAWLATKAIMAGSVLSVGCKNDDREYFHLFQPFRYVKMDVDADFKPDVVHDFNLPLNQGQLNELGLFDNVLLLGLSLYIWDTATMMANLRAVTKRGGQLWIYSPFLHPEHGVEDRDYTRHTKHFWEKVLKESGFEITEYRSIPFKNKEHIINAWSDDGIKIRDGVDYNVTGHLMIAKKK